MRRLLVALLLLFAAPALAQPFPVSIKVDASVQGLYGPLVYRVTVAAARQVDVRVRVNVIVPGGEQSGWKTLWEGSLGEGETRVIEAREDRVPRLGSYVIWVAVDFTSPRDFMVIGGRYYYASYDLVHVLTVYEPGAERWMQLYLKAFNDSERYRALYEDAAARLSSLSERCRALEAQLSSLQASYASLEANYSRLLGELEALRGQLSSLRTERDGLRAVLERAEARARELYTLSLALAALSLLLGGALAVLSIKPRWLRRVPS